MLALIVAACGGTTGNRIAGGESHFLETCTLSCGSGLECISGLCTRRCEAAAADCTDLATTATCAVESNEVTGVCDVSCERDRDCAALGAEFRCSAGACRTKLQSGDPPSGGSGGSGGAGNGGSGASTFNPECSPRLDFRSECSFEDTCTELHCGDGFSQFGADGCTRYCQADADCAAGERCRHTLLVRGKEDCPALGSEVEGCTVEDGKCSCSVTADCDWPSICVDAARFPESEDCAVEGLGCADLNGLDAAAYWARSSDGPSELRQEAQACFARTQARRTELACGVNPLTSFAPACDEPPAVTSSCDFVATCEALGCGDGFSQFGADGCTRYCETSADCGAGQRCRHTSFVLSEDECPSPGSEIEDCELVGGECQCTETLDCPRPNICVDATQYPESLDCAVEGASCLALSFGAESVQTFLDSTSSPAAATEARACLDAIRAKQTELSCD